jgi:MFS family permease
MITSFFALFLSVILLQLSSGGVGPLDALSGIKLEFSTQQIGMLGSAHFLGFFIGCWWAPRLMGSVGHSRAFATFTAAGAIGLLAHMMLVDAYAWSLMRVASGMCMAGCYTVIEAWLNSRVTNENRGRAMGSYRIVDTGASLVAQLLVAVLEPADYLSYNLLAICCCASLLPMTLTQARQPETPKAPRLRPGLAWACSPLAVAGVMTAALSSASFRMVGPIYGQNVGLQNEQIAYFLAAFVAGGAIAQYPVGWIADKYDRRWVLIGLSVAAIFSCGITVLASTGGTTTVMAAAVLFGLTTFPLFSVSAAHAHDFATNEQRVELSAALMFFFALGAIASPYATSALITVFGPPALFAFIAASHFILIIFSLIRMRRRASVTVRTPYIYIPRSSFTIGSLLNKLRDRD